MSPGKRIPSRTPRQENIKSQEQEAKILLVGHKGSSEWYHPHFHLLASGPVNPDYGRNSTLYLMLIQSTYIQPSRGPCPSSAACCHMAGTVTVSSKAHFSVLSNQLLWDSEQNDMTSDFHEQVPTVTLLSQEWVPWKKVMLCRISWLWIRQSVSSQMMIIWEELQSTG